ncbi:F0F1 ATP synthase subunit gamma [Candidatus Curtissbacteria bacterium]|nr:F0F1 ATP synthase subunit gamma [Candidatus Curtissbacteria bacterium]
MFTPKQLKKELELNLALKGLTETYEDVAVSRMQAIRRDVLQNRRFLEGVSEIYSLAKSAYLKQLATVIDVGKREKQLQFIRRNRKIVTVLISGNRSLLGNIVLQTFKVYMSLAQKIESDHVILGHIGSYLAATSKPPLDFVEYEFDDYSAAEEQMVPIVNYISQYEKILVVYPKFVSVLRQVPQIDDISGGIAVEKPMATTKNYFFEPTSGDVMAYFEGQIIGTLFRQKILEAMLARYGARLTIMDHANQTIKRIVKQNLQAEQAVIRREGNKKLLSAFGGMSLWEGMDQ